MEQLHDYSQRISGARMLIHRLRDHRMMDMRKNDDKIYRDAYLDCLFDNPAVLDLFLSGDTPRIGYRNHKRDKNGKLVSCEAYIMKG